MAFIFESFKNFFWGILSAVGLANKEGTILFLGLDNAGKTTLMCSLTNNQVQVLLPTQHPTSQTVQVEKLTLTIHDLGGHEQARRLWRDYFVSVSGVVYVIDIADRGRWAESKRELDKLLDLDVLQGVPFVILANKTDMPGTPPLEEVIHAFGIQHLINKERNGQRPFNIFPTSVVVGSGIGEAFSWFNSIF